MDRGRRRKTGCPAVDSRNGVHRSTPMPSIPGSADQPTLSFHWSFGDGAGALGADTSHTYANTGSYPVTVTVTDKDGGVGAASLTADITKRQTSLAYTGDLQALPNHFTALSAHVTDQLGLAVVGRPVMFTLGTQGGSGLTDGAGTARTAFRLKQHVGDYTVTATSPATRGTSGRPTARATRSGTRRSRKGQARPRGGLPGFGRTPEPPREEWDSNPRASCPANGFQDRRLRPLGHPPGRRVTAGQMGSRGLLRPVTLAT
jgi:PKD domain